MPERDCHMKKYDACVGAVGVEPLVCAAVIALHARRKGGTAGLSNEPPIWNVTLKSM